MNNTIEPTSFTAGDTVKWTKDLSETYPVSEGWTLSYAIRGAVVLDVNADTDDVLHSITIDATTSSTLTAGDYWWQAFVTKASEKYTIDEGQFTVKPNLVDAEAGFDNRTHSQKTLDAIKAILENRATLEQQSYMIAGRSLSRRSIDELLKLKNHYEKRVKSENGEFKSRIVKARFC